MHIFTTHRFVVRKNSGISYVRPSAAGLLAQISYSTPLLTLIALVVVTTICVPATSHAEEVGLFASSEYRLSVEKPDTFRLPSNEGEAKELDVPVLEPRKESAAALWLADRPFAKLIESAAREAALEPALVHAIISVESGYNPTARSPKGAIGLMQVMPQTAARYGVTDAGRSPELNLKVGTRYLSDLMELFDNRLDLVLAAYNAGENAVLRYGQRIPPYRETQLYVPAVLAKYYGWREPLPVVLAEERGGREALPAMAPTQTRIQYMPGTNLDLNFLRAEGYR